MAIESNQEDEKRSVRRPFFIASDEGDIWSEHVICISGGQQRRKKYTNLHTHESESSFCTPRIPASRETVRQIFRERGYDFIDEKEIAEREAQTAAKPKTTPEP